MKVKISADPIPKPTPPVLRAFARRRPPACPTMHQILCGVSFMGRSWGRPLQEIIFRQGPQRAILDLLVSPDPKREQFAF